MPWAVRCGGCNCTRLPVACDDYATGKRRLSVFLPRYRQRVLVNLPVRTQRARRYAEDAASRLVSARVLGLVEVVLSRVFDLSDFTERALISWLQTAGGVDTLNISDAFENTRISRLR